MTIAVVLAMLAQYLFPRIDGAKLFGMRDELFRKIIIQPPHFAGLIQFDSFRP